MLSDKEMYWAARIEGEGRRAGAKFNPYCSPNGEKMTREDHKKLRWVVKKNAARVVWARSIGYLEAEKNAFGRAANLVRQTVSTGYDRERFLNDQSWRWWDYSTDTTGASQRRWFSIPDNATPAPEYIG